MKIALACRVYPTHRPGGLPFVCQDRARALAKLGHEVRVLTTGSIAGSVVDLDEKIRVEHLECDSSIYSSRYSEECFDYCVKWMPDIIHSDSLDVNRRWWVGFGEKGVKTAVTLHGFAWGAFFTKWNLFRLGKGEAPTFDGEAFLKERNAINSFKTIIGISKHEQWMLRDLFGLPAQLVYNPIPDYFFDTPQIDPPKERSFLCASISGQAERLFDLADRAADKAGYPIRRVSNVPRNEMPAVYDSVSALVLPTAYSQGYDLTVAESLARGKPVICSATGSYLREAEVTPGIVTVPLGDVEELTNAMQRDLPIIPGGSGSVKHRPEIHAQRWLEAIG